MEKRIYLKNFDNYLQILEYDTYEGSHRITTRDEITKNNVKISFGTFVVEGNNVVGVYATPKGPVFFKNETKLLGSLGAIKVEIQKNVKPGINHFSLYSKGQRVFETTYLDRDGIDCNPYDTEEEDINMFVMLSNATEKSQFFINYTKDWL
ncbi:hypothetical protein [Undibacterium sp. Ren11W]|uniref:hypothetical protein n=1 Tax=Undibacterium sp. Ren11W TaxID=3413045 RepID=UPI003BF1EEFB